MTQLTTPAPTTLVLRRTYAAPRAAVFAAWSRRESLERFMGPGEHTARVLELEFRPGGRYRIAMDRPGQETFFAVGVYHEIVADERIVCSWTWEEDDPAEMHETTLRVEFFPHGDGTELVLTHSNFVDAASRDRHAEGWNRILDQLATTLA